MRVGILMWAGWVMLLLLALTRWRSMVAGFETGILIGAALVVFVLYPAYLRNFERRLAELERGKPGA